MDGWRLSTQSISQFGFTGAQTLIPQLCQLRRVCFTVRYCAKEALAACPQKIADHARQLELAFFEQTLQLTLEPNLVACQLILGPSQGSPTSLFCLRDKAQNQIAGQQTAHCTLGITEVCLAAPGTTIRAGLR